LAKRLLDVVGSGVGLAILAPVVPMIAAAVYLDDPGPVFYKQRRAGMLKGFRKTDGLDAPEFEEFDMYKFRSMRVDAEKMTGAVLAQEDDPRITRIGKFLRKSRLDEIPQLWNVFKGEMSLVGPRPERPEFVTSLTRTIPFYGERHAIRPGLTGWAQVRYTYGASTEDAMEKLQYDLFYIKNMSIALDLFILFDTVKTVLLYRGA
jgi:lipopolysaccharide/colanic/teichoic acid biosynthesis glycosyltransferase